MAGHALTKQPLLCQVLCSRRPLVALTTSWGRFGGIGVNLTFRDEAGWGVLLCDKASGAAPHDCDDEEQEGQEGEEGDHHHDLGNVALALDGGGCGGCVRNRHDSDGSDSDGFGNVS